MAKAKTKRKKSKVAPEGAKHVKKLFVITGIIVVALIVLIFVLTS
jgi:hypothetical protein